MAQPLCAHLCMLCHLADVLVLLGCVPRQLGVSISSNRLGSSDVSLAAVQHDIQADSQPGGQALCTQAAIQSTSRATDCRTV